MNNNNITHFCKLDDTGCFETTEDQFQFQVPFSFVEDAAVGHIWLCIAVIPENYCRTRSGLLFG